MTAMDTRGRFAAGLAMAACVVITLAIWLSVSAHQSMWPLPALYLVEMVALAIAATLAMLGAGSGRMLIVWAAIGAMAGFCVLGAWSVGLYYAPVALMFAVLVGSSDFRRRRFQPMHLGACLLAGAAQAGIMLAVMRT